MTTPSSGGTFNASPVGSTADATPAGNPSTPATNPSTPAGNPSTPASNPSTPASNPSTPASTRGNVGGGTGTTGGTTGGGGTAGVGGGEPNLPGEMSGDEARYGSEHPEAWPGPPANPNPPEGVVGEGAEANPRNQAGNLDAGGPFAIEPSPVDQAVEETDTPQTESNR